MKAHHAQEAFESVLLAGQRRYEGLTVAEGAAAVFAFYRTQRAEDCPSDADGDMLLYQWGLVQEDEGSHFEFNLTRQFILGGDSEDENIWQLSLTFTFEPTQALVELGSGNKWCPKPRPQAIDYFERFVRESATYRAVCEMTPRNVTLDYFNAG